MYIIPQTGCFLCLGNIVKGSLGGILMGLAVDFVFK